MRKLLTLGTLALILVTSACGVGRPLPPTIVDIMGSGYYQPWTGASNASTYDQTLSNITLFWDVSDINGAAGVEVIMATQNSCNEKYVIASQYVYMLVNDSTTNGNNTYMNNLATLFNYQTFQAKQYFVCVKVIKYNGSKSPASWPAYLTVRSPYYGY